MKQAKVKIKPPSWFKKWLLSKVDFSAGSSDELVLRLRAAQNKNIIAPNSLSMMEGVIQVDIRPAIVVPEGQKLESLLAHFRRSRNHMAVVVDEYSGTAGLVTIEDVLEQIVGTEIDVFNDYFKMTLPNSTFDTVGGVVTNEFGKIPKQYEELVIEDMTFRVLRSDSRRIQLLEIQTAKAA